jgi:hypothetical protein
VFDQGGLFNAYSEEGYETGSPENTEWFFGHTDSVYNEQYISWEELVDTSSGIIGQFISLHILSENKYFDVVFHDWTGGDNGGGFSYTRMQIDVDTGPLVNGSISGTVIFASDSAAIEGALVVAVAEDSSYSGQVYTGSDGTYNMDLAGSLNYYVNISYDGLIDYNEYVFVAPFENTTVDASMEQQKHTHYSQLNHRKRYSHNNLENQQDPYYMYRRCRYKPDRYSYCLLQRQQLTHLQWLRCLRQK